MSGRKLATIREIAEVKPIEGADRIVAYRVDGWWVVDQKDKYQVGDLVIYAEPDSWVPHDLAPFLSKGKEPGEYEGVKGNRLRTIKLKGQLSQGLLLSVEAGFGGYPFIIAPNGEQVVVMEGDNVTDCLGIKKWERPIPPQLCGLIRGDFPSYVPRTDQERIQNCYEDIIQIADDQWEVTEKLEGSSLTVIHRDGDLHVCSRNLSLKLDDDSNTFVKVAKQTRILEALPLLGRNIAIQGELVGPGIQCNIYELSSHAWFVFDIFDIDQQRYLNFEEREAMLELIETFGVILDRAPFLSIRVLTGESLDGILKEAEGKSRFNPKQEREGIVFKNLRDPNISFKAISNKYLLWEK